MEHSARDSASRIGFGPVRRALTHITRVALVVALSLGSKVPFAAPLPAVGGPLLDVISAMPEGQWQRVNRNLYSDAWTPSDLRPLNKGSNMPPSKIILAWSSFGCHRRTVRRSDSSAARSRGGRGRSPRSIACCSTDAVNRRDAGAAIATRKPCPGSPAASESRCRRIPPAAGPLTSRMRSGSG